MAGSESITLLPLLSVRRKGGVSPTDQEVCDVVEKIATKTIKLLRKKGYLQEEGEAVVRPDLDQLFQDHPGMTEAMAASIQSKIAFSERAGEKVRR